MTQQTDRLNTALSGRYRIERCQAHFGRASGSHQVIEQARYNSYRDLQRVSKMVFDAAMLIDHAPPQEIRCVQD